MDKKTVEGTPDLAKNILADDRVVALDFETYYEKGVYSLNEMTPYEYTHDPRFDAFLVSIYGPGISPTIRPDENGMQLYVGRPELFDGWKNLKDRIIVIHNAGFDSVVIDRLVELGKIPNVISGMQCRCTADLAAYHGMRRKLANVMLVGFDRDIMEEKSKVRDVGMNGKHVEDLTPEEYADLIAYAGHDAIECREVWCKFAIPQGVWYGWPTKEREISTRIRAPCKRRFRVDVDHAPQCLKPLLTIRKSAEDRIPWTKWHKKRKVTNSITKEVTYVETNEYYTALSPAGLREAVIAAKVEPPKSFAKNSPEFIDWIEHHQDLDFVFARQRYASVNVHIGALEKLIAMTDPNGIIRPNLTYFGAATGRTSSKINDESREDADNVNMLNLPRNPLLDGDETVKSILEPWYEAKRKAEPDYPPVCTSGVDMRGMYMARPGHKLVVFDYSQVEARFSLWYVKDTHMMDALKVEGNLYQANAVAMKWCESKADIKHKDPDRYRLAKCCVLGLGYGMGAAKFIDSCKAQRLTLPVLPKDQWNEPTFVSKPHFDSDMRVVEEGFNAKLFDRSKFAIRSALHIGDKDMLLPENEEAVGRFLYSQKVVNEWRAANAPIVAMWGKLADDFRARVAAGKKTYSIRLPSGRIKWYWYPEIRAEETEEYDEHGVKHIGCSYRMSAIVVRDRTLRDQKKFPYGVPKFFTGGHLMENVVQATCRDIMEYSAGEIAEKYPSWHFLFSCYDEQVWEVPDDEVSEAEKVIPYVMCHGDSIKDWTLGMPLDVEGVSDYRYAK